MGPFLKVDLKFDALCPDLLSGGGPAGGFLSSAHDSPLPFAIYSLRFSVNETMPPMQSGWATPAARDGKQLALSRGTRTSDVILIKDFR